MNKTNTNTNTQIIKTDQVRKDEMIFKAGQDAWLLGIDDWGACLYTAPRERDLWERGHKFMKNRFGFKKRNYNNNSIPSANNGGVKSGYRKTYQERTK